LLDVEASHFLGIRLTDDGEVDNLTRLPSFTSRNIPGMYLFLLEAESILLEAESNTGLHSGW
jgi:hypothetical protein